MARRWSSARQMLSWPPAVWLQPSRTAQGIHVLPALDRPTAAGFAGQHAAGCVTAIQSRCWGGMAVKS
jgi:hypothetical protein